MPINLFVLLKMQKKSLRMKLYNIIFITSAGSQRVFGKYATRAIFLRINRQNSLFHDKNFFLQRGAASFYDFLGFTWMKVEFDWATGNQQDTSKLY